MLQGRDVNSQRTGAVHQRCQAGKADVGKTDHCRQCRYDARPRKQNPYHSLALPVNTTLQRGRRKIGTAPEPNRNRFPGHRLEADIQNIRQIKLRGVRSSEYERGYIQWESINLNSILAYQQLGSLMITMKADIY